MLIFSPGEKDAHRMTGTGVKGNIWCRGENSGGEEKSSSGGKKKMAASPIEE